MTLKVEHAPLCPFNSKHGVLGALQEPFISYSPRQWELSAPLPLKSSFKIMVYPKTSLL